VNRRAFVTGLGALLAAPLGVEAQRAKRMPRIAFLTTTSPGSSPTTDAFRQGLRELGYVEGQNIVIEWRWGRGGTERFPEFAAEVVRLNVDVIVAANDAAGRAAQRATGAIPIVIPTIGDPVAGGFVASLAKPGGNITGVTTSSPDVAGKRLQIFKEILPRVSKVGLLVDVTDLGHSATVREIETAASALNIRVGPRVDVSNPGALGDAFGAMVKESATAVFAVGGTMLYANRARLAALAVNNRLPMMCGPSAFVSAGCLMGYSANLADMFRRAASYVDRILKGASPAELPVEQPTKFDLAINMKTAKALGLTIPASLLLRADQVIE
jgi:putative tryptophan/tyrosine transport system substrate-binding protein